jgi:hypothetical protein
VAQSEVDVEVKEEENVYVDVKQEASAYDEAGGQRRHT